MFQSLSGILHCSAQKKWQVREPGLCGFNPFQGFYIVLPKKSVGVIFFMKVFQSLSGILHCSASSLSLAVDL